MEVLDDEGDEVDDKDSKAHMDMVYMANMGNILGSDCMGDTRMDRTMGRTKRYPKDSKCTKNCNTKGYTSLYILS